MSAINDIMLSSLREAKAAACLIINIGIDCLEEPQDVVAMFCCKLRSYQLQSKSNGSRLRLLRKLLYAAEIKLNCAIRDSINSPGRNFGPSPMACSCPCLLRYQMACRALAQALKLLQHGSKTF